MKPTKCPGKKKKGQEKRKRGEERKRKVEVKTEHCVTFKPKNYLKILLSAHA